MRQALLDNRVVQSKGRAFTANIPAPTGGLNTRDSVAEMPPLDATVLDNWMVRAGEVQLRGGSASWATGMTGGVKSIFQYQPAAAAPSSAYLYAATNAGIYDITSSGAVGAVAMALTDGYIDFVNFTNSAGTSYLWGCNGADNVKLYDGAAWSTISAAITGVSAASLIAPWLFKHRIFAIEKNTLNAWFLPLDSIQGAATRVALGNIFRGGGVLVAGANWTLDAGDGPDDLCVFITSQGELAVYKGIDPSSASSWSLIGVYSVGKPAGRRCFVRLGADLGVVVESGFYLLSRLLKSGSVNFASALSNKIQSIFTSAFLANGGTSTQGWEVKLYPQYDAALLNIPVSGAAIQLVMNTITGAWSSFSGWNASVFHPMPTKLLWGVAGTGTVMYAWDGLLVADSGADITTTVHTAWNYYGSRTMLKKVDLFRPLLAYDGSVETRWAISPDYLTVSITSILSRTAAGTAATWDVSAWDTSFWASSAQRQKLWRAAFHYPGYALSLWLQTASNNSTISWSGTDYIVTAGGAL